MDRDDQGVDCSRSLRRKEDVRVGYVDHVNHGFRPGESEREAELVRKETARYRLPFELRAIQC
jgi:tRNA(Ile)-lysidine synthase TilS/MesJ